MPTKYETFAELSARTEKLLTGSAESWKSFLVAAARLYKYPYHEQLLIFAQRPDATAWLFMSNYAQPGIILLSPQSLS